MPAIKGWGPRRYLTLLIVLCMHVLLVTLFLTVRPTHELLAVSNAPIQLLILPPAALPKVRSENLKPQRLNGETGITIAPPSLGYSNSLAAAPSGSNGNGVGVDWAAEARRALQAYEIRSAQRASNNASSGPPTEDTWWPQGQHHAGEQYKNDTGDWIVWVDANCYQIARAGSSLAAPGTLMPQTHCKENPP